MVFTIINLHESLSLLRLRFFVRFVMCSQLLFRMSDAEFSRHHGIESIPWIRRVTHNTQRTIRFNHLVLPFHHITIPRLVLRLLVAAIQRTVVNSMEMGRCIILKREEMCFFGDELMQFLFVAYEVVDVFVGAGFSRFSFISLLVLIGIVTAAGNRIRSVGDVFRRIIVVTMITGRTTRWRRIISIGVRVSNQQCTQTPNLQINHKRSLFENRITIKRILRTCAYMLVGWCVVLFHGWLRWLLNDNSVRASLLYLAHFFGLRCLLLMGSRLIVTQY